MMEQIQTLKVVILIGEVCRPAQPSGLAVFWM